jgi:hypothetical protein
LFSLLDFSAIISYGTCTSSHHQKPSNLSYTYPHTHPVTPAYSHHLQPSNFLTTIASILPSHHFLPQKQLIQVQTRYNPSQNKLPHRTNNPSSQPHTLTTTMPRLPTTQYTDDVESLSSFEEVELERLRSRIQWEMRVTCAIFLLCLLVSVVVIKGWCCGLAASTAGADGEGAIGW